MPHFVQGDCTNSLLLPGSIISTTEQLLETSGCFSGFSFPFFFFLNMDYQFQSGLEPVTRW